jgi:endoglucanase
LYNLTDSPSILAPAKVQNASYASTLLKHANSLHKFAVNATGGQTTTQTSVSEVADAYSSSGYGDDLALSALFLSWVSNSSLLDQDAEGYYSKYKLGGQDDVFNWDDRSPGLAVLFVQVISATPSLAAAASKKLSDWKSEAESYFDRIVNGKSRGQLTKGMCSVTPV